MKKITLAVIFIFSLNTIYSQATGASALIVLDEIDASIKEHLQSIDNLATNAIGNGGNMLLSISARLRKDINETIGNTDIALRENQLNIYNQLLGLVNDFNVAIETNLDRVDLTATRISQAASDLVFKKREPTIFKYKTQKFIQGFDNEYTLAVKGNSFDRSYDVYIVLNDNKIKPIQSNYSELIFKIDAASLKPNVKNENYVSGKIIFKWKDGWIFKSDRTSVENFFIPIIPLKLGTAQVYFEQELPKKKLSEPLSYGCSCSTGKSSITGSKRKSSTAFNVLPTGGRKIDINSIKVTDWRQRYGGSYGFEHKTEQQIKGSISCNSDGKSYGGGGFSTLTFTYNEFEIIYEVTQDSTTIKDLTTANPVLFDLPDPVDGKNPNIKYVEVKTYDNKTFTLVPNSVNELFSLKLNPATHDVLVEWKN
ncbi:hypothetical protein [Ulvibacterium marinum]|nr:hypothetical protein [Ulvibacterium marinum]